MSVLAILEQRGGAWNRASLETLAAACKLAAELGCPALAAVAGSGVTSLAQEAAGYGVDKVFALDHALLEPYTADGHAAAFEQLIRAVSPGVVLFPHTYQVRDFAPKLATRFGTVLISDVVAIRVEAGGAVFVRQLFQGKLNADVRAAAAAPHFAPHFASLQAGAYRAAEPAGAANPVEAFAVALDAARIRTRPEPPFREAQRSVDLSSAEIIVSVGRGIQEKENLHVVEELAAALGAELAASRPICDNGWLPMERQVGSSGQTVAPKVYFAVGISGAIQHLVGMKGAKTVVAINKDQNAPIFEIADYGVVGDLFEIVPALVAEIRRSKA